MRKELLLSTAMCTLMLDAFKKAATNSGAPTYIAKIAAQPCKNVLLAGESPQPHALPSKTASPEELTDEEQNLPQSVEMVVAMLAEIAHHNYNIWPQYLVWHPAMFSGGQIGIAIAPLYFDEKKKSFEAAETRDQEPQIYDALYDMLSDLRMFSGDPRAQFVPEELYFEMPDKKSLYDMLKNYLGDEDFTLYLPDDLRARTEGKSYLSMADYNDYALNHETAELTIGLSELRIAMEKEGGLNNSFVNAAPYIGLN